MTYSTDAEEIREKEQNDKSRQMTRGRKCVIGGVVVLCMATLAISAAVLTAFLASGNPKEIITGPTALFRRKNDEFSLEVELDRKRSFETVHYIPRDQETETFVLYDFKVRKVVLKLMSDKTCYLRDMDSVVEETEIDNIWKSYESEGRSTVKIDMVKKQYFQAMNAAVPTSTLSTAILEFCSGFKLQLLKLTPNKETANENSRHRRGLFDAFRAYANQRLAGIRASLGSFRNTKPNVNGGDVGVVSVGGALPDVFPDATIPVAGTFPGKNQGGTVDNGFYGLFDAFRAYAKNTLTRIGSRLGGLERTAKTGGNARVSGGFDKPRNKDVGAFGGAFPDDTVDLPNPNSQNPGKPDGGVLPAGPGGTNYASTGTDVRAFGGIPPDGTVIDPPPPPQNPNLFPPKGVDTSRGSQRTADCKEQVQCTFHELGCTVRRERYCPDPGWTFGVDCDSWQYTNVKACANIRKCETSCM